MQKRTLADQNPWLDCKWFYRVLQSREGYTRVPLQTSKWNALSYLSHLLTYKQWQIFTFCMKHSCAPSVHQTIGQTRSSTSRNPFSAQKHTTRSQQTRSSKAFLSENSFSPYFRISNIVLISQPVNKNTFVQGGDKKCGSLLLSISSPIIDWFSKFFHWHTLQTICNNMYITYLTTS